MRLVRVSYSIKGFKKYVIKFFHYKTSLSFIFPIINQKTNPLLAFVSPCPFFSLLIVLSATNLTLGKPSYIHTTPLQMKNQNEEDQPQNNNNCL